MWKYVSSFFWRETSAEALLPLEEAYNIISECEKFSPNEPKNEEVEELQRYEVFNKVGKITEIINDTYVVDNLHEFITDVEGLSVGTKISYQLLKSENGDVKVVDVHIIENDWNVTDTGKKQWHERILVCSVANRDGRVLTLTPGNIQINLDKIRSDFIPIVGDWLELDVKCESDEHVVDLNGKVLEINKLQPMRLQVKSGKITHWDFDTKTGIIDKNIFFDRDSLYCGYIPVRNDKVVTQIIESNQGICTWRALQVIPESYSHHYNADKPDPDKIVEDICLETHESVTITDNINLIFTKLGEGKLFLVEIHSQKELELVCIELPKLNGQCQLTSNVDHFKIKPLKPLTIRFECRAKAVGETQETIIFHFKDFKIKRLVKIQVVSRQPTQNIRKNNTCDSFEKQTVPRLKKDIIRGQRVVHSARFIPFHIPEFAVPDRLFNLLERHKQQPNNNILKSELEKMKPCLVTGLNYMNFEDKYHTLLHLDEIYMKMEMQNYDKERACFIKSGEYLLLEIENLAERRPSVIVSDRVFARSLKDKNSPDYEGFIHKLGKNHLYIKFSQIFHDSYDGEDFSIYIVGSRTTYRREHFAVNLAVRNLGKDWLFPSKLVEKEPQLDLVDDTLPANGFNLLTSKPSNKRLLLEKIRKFHEGNLNDLPDRYKLEWHNKNLNRYQKEAVRRILNGSCRPLPYIIFGPPGTGKTITVVETVLQILTLLPHSRILVSAPSNSAADLLALRLIDSGVLKPGDLIRLVALSAVASIPAKLAPYCATANIEREGTETSLPVVSPNGLVLGYSSSVLGRHRITVSTCSSAGVLYSMGFSKGHFSHIIVDEAGQTSEPSVLIPLAFLDISSGQAILAGDPMQLGPVILSKIAGEYGLEESFLERMINRFPYMRDSQGFPNSSGYDPRLITKLLYNYRSLPELLKLPSLLFYNDELIPTISESDSKEGSLLSQLKEILPVSNEGKLTPIVFHGVIGENYQSEDCPSWFNPSEASQVFFYVNECYRLGLKASDIGIITPYKAQARQLIDLFNEAEFESPKVGTVEEYQGQEFNVVILSTVRSNRRYVDADIKHTMGFLASPRRLNVAITRAKALLIIVGNPNLLSEDRAWRSVINYCKDKGSFIGCAHNKRR